MESIAKALVLTVQYINGRTDFNTEDDDARALEEAASIVQSATPEEKALLIKVAQQLGLENWAEQIGLA